MKALYRIILGLLVVNAFLLGMNIPTIKFVERLLR